MFAAEDIYVVQGANQGDGLTGPAEVCVGDVYHLRRLAEPLRLLLCKPEAGGQTVAPGSEVGRAGAGVRLEARYTLMAPDGDRVDLLILRVEADSQIAPPRGTSGSTSHLTSGGRSLITSVSTPHVTPDSNPHITSGSTSDSAPHVTPGGAPNVTAGSNPNVTADDTSGTTTSSTPGSTPGSIPGGTSGATSNGTSSGNFGSSLDDTAGGRHGGTPNGTPGGTSNDSPDDTAGGTSGGTPIGNAEAIRVALPLSPVGPGVDYTLLSVEAAPEGLHLADMLCLSFARGTMITLGTGKQCAIEALQPGTQVLTRDHGRQPVRWIGHTRLRAVGSFAPVVIVAGTIGNAGDLIVSQHHRVFLYQRRRSPGLATAELLVQARDLVDGTTVYLREGGFVDYFSLVFDRHEIIYAEGVPSESLMVNDATVNRLPPEVAAEVKARFPGLAHVPHFGTEASREFLAELGAELGAERLPGGRKG